MTSEDTTMNDKEIEAEKSSVAGHRARVRDSIDHSSDLDGFADYELLEYILFATIPRKDTKPLAKELIRVFGSRSAGLDAEYDELIRIDGIGGKTAHLLANMLHIALRAEQQRFGASVRLETPQKTAEYMYARFLGQRKERMLLVSLTLENEVIQTNVIAEGTVDTTFVDVLKILRYADRNGAKKIILAHNHPGGTMTFSQADISLTARVVVTCMQTGIEFLDHLVFCDNRYCSMFGNDLLPELLEACKRESTDVAKHASFERSRLMNMAELLRERESHSAGEAQMQAIETYKELLRLPEQMRNEIFAAMFDRMTPEKVEQ